MPTPPRRRWYQFGLRTMFMVVTVFAIWLGWELRFVRQRQAMLREITEARGEVVLAGDLHLAFKLNGVEYRIPQLPFWRVWLGDKAVYQINLHQSGESTNPDYDLVAARFPEARVECPELAEQLMEFLKAKFRRGG